MVGGNGERCLIFGNYLEKDMIVILELDKEERGGQCLLFTF